jgi:hypothetical protein
MAVRGANVTGIDLSEKPLGVAKLHLLESGQTVEYRKISVEQMADEMPEALRCSDLPGNARTCAESFQQSSLPPARDWSNPVARFSSRP